MKSPLRSTSPRALFLRYAECARILPWVELGFLPTPVQHIPTLAGQLGLERLFLKRDDLSGTVYGGNKVRKLEFLLAHAAARGAERVITFGGAGSNHALATAIYARRLGLRSTSFLLSQANAAYVQRNLLYSAHVGAEIHHVSRLGLLKPKVTAYRAWHRLRYGRPPYIIPGGGSNPRGTIGYVNAALELQEQVRAGELPEPDRVYVALGSGGTAAGLALGFQATGLASVVHGVRVTPREFLSPAKLYRLFRDTARFLRACDSTFPSIQGPPRNLVIRDGFLGPGYACFTPEGTEARELMNQSEGVPLEGTYTGKALAAVVHDARNGVLANQTVVFWNTHNSRPFPPEALQADFRKLPRSVRHYFLTPVQDAGGSVQENHPSENHMVTG